mgnify:CR=1 FL=1
MTSLLEQLPKIVADGKREAERITAFSDTIRRSVRAPIGFGDRQIFLTASIGLALLDGQTQERNAARNSLVSGWAVFSASGSARCNSSASSGYREPD